MRDRLVPFFSPWLTFGIHQIRLILDSHRKNPLSGDHLLTKMTIWG